MGKVVTVAQQKGGAGKTTLAVNLACAALAEGRRVALLDTDPQGSMGRWFMARRERGEPGLSFSTSSAWGVSYECEKLARDHDLVLVDTPPKVDADLRPALREAALVLVPVATSQVDLWATESVLDLARREGADVLIVLNRASPRARLTAQILQRVQEVGPAARTRVGARVLYAETLGEGRGVNEARPSGPAAAEMAALWAEVRDAAGLE
jgi:chromosome partitioning protein